jgi:hypothetical protein
MKIKIKKPKDMPRSRFMVIAARLERLISELGGSVVLKEDSRQVAVQEVNINDL